MGSELHDEVASVDDLLAGLTALRLPTTSGRLPSAALVTPGLAGATLAQTAEALLVFFLDLDDLFGGDALHAPLGLFVNRLALAVGEDSDDSTLAAFGALAQLAGWLALDGNRHGAARRYFNAAIYAAHQADEPALTASSLAYLSL